MMHHPGPLAAYALLLSLFVSGCSGKSSPAVSVAPTPIACGDPTPLVNSEAIGRPAAESALWLVAGPLRFGVYAPFKPGSPTKVPITLGKPLEADVTLKGWRCSDGHPLRFWYPRGNQAYPVWDPNALETAGERVVTFQALGTSAASAFGGYILFTSPGKWKVSIAQGGQHLASVIFVVPAPA
jgi:hypothetical protein